MRKLFSEILKEVQEAPTTDDKVMVLQANNTTMLRQLLMAAFDPKITFDVDTSALAYRENFETDGYASNNLYVEYRRLYIFLEKYKEVSPKRKLALLTQILESIDVSDAVCLVEVINKDLEKYELSIDIINQAFPGLIKQ